MRAQEERGAVCPPLSPAGPFTPRGYLCQDEANYICKTQEPGGRAGYLA